MYYAGYVDIKGYGRIWNNVTGKTELAHRVAWFNHHNKQIPAGLVLDHLCRNRSCINPEHLEPVTIAENTRRGLSENSLNALKTKCARGHNYDKANTIYMQYKTHVKRRCRECRKYFNRIHQREFRARQRVLGVTRQV